MIELKNLYQRSFLGGICFGFGILGSSLFSLGISQSIVIALSFLVALELGFPLLTEMSGDAKLMTTVMTYITPDVYVLKLFSRKIIPANILGITLITLGGGYFCLNSPEFIHPEFSKTWLSIFVSAFISGALIDLASNAYHKDKQKLPILLAVFLVTLGGLNHFLLDFPTIIWEILHGGLGIFCGLKILLLSIFGNFLGSRLRTLLIKENKK